MDYSNKSLKSQFKLADKFNPLFTAILGDTELHNNQINIKNNQTESQETINLDDLYLYVCNYIKKQVHACSVCKEKGE